MRHSNSVDLVGSAVLCSTLQYPADHSCSTRSTQIVQYPQYPQYPAVPTGTVQYLTATFYPCSTHSTHSTLQYPWVLPQYPTATFYPCSTHSTHSTLQYPWVLLQYPTVTFCSCSTHSTHSTLQYPRVLCSTQIHPQYPQYLQYLAVPPGSTHSTRTAAVPTGTVQYPPG